jgi:hypothetical protein
MVAVPAVKPETRPVDPTVATVGLLLLQVPPDVVSVNPVVKPVHKVEAPMIGDIGVTFVTVMVAVTKQPVVSSYVTVQVPAKTPVTKPELEFTVAIAPFELDHVPPDVPSVKWVVPPTVTEVVPLIDEGNGLTLTAAEPVIVLTQPVEVFVATMV